jgi:DNA-binding transcriptional LysR family regulator
MDGIELRELRYFITVAEELNFTRAAVRLGMAQPPLSAAISKLERKLGVGLLERTSRRVALTPAGVVLLEQGRIAVEAAGAAVERARRAGTQADRLTVAVKPGAGTDLVKKIMQRCAEDQRMPEVHILFGHPGGPAAAVRGGAADVAILRAPFDRRGLDTELLLTEPRVAVLPAHHRLAARPELRRADLAGEPMPRWAGQADPVAAAYWSGTDTPSPARNQNDHPQGPEINDISQLLDAVALGNAVAYVPSPLPTSTAPPAWPSYRSATSASVNSWPLGRTPAAPAPSPASSARPSKWPRTTPSRRLLSPDPRDPERPSVS